MKVHIWVLFVIDHRTDMFLSVIVYTQKRNTDYGIARVCLSIRPSVCSYAQNLQNIMSTRTRLRVVFLLLYVYVYEF